MALAVGRAREGQCAWEVAHLWTCGAPSSALVELLERVSASAGHAGGRRVFLRLRDTSPIIEKARQAGFQLVAQETLYRSSSQLVAPACGTSPPGLRPRHPGDGPALFRLYLASAPRRVVCAYGLTFEEWRHALENTGERPHEWVLETAGVLQVWLRLWHHPTGSLLCALALPTVPGLAQGIGMALQTRSRDRPVLALVPDYQPQLGAALEETGFSAEATYSTLVKPLAVSAREVAFAPAAT
ncbi:MAG: hypothetical protein HY683_00040 [Chloroflexi bacterium]|nr:hypothetical protein [Chloroflexota bacterium]